MLERGKIDSRQAIWLMITLILPTALLTLPHHAVALAGRDGWLSISLATLEVVILALIVMHLSARFPGKNMFEYPELILGPVLGKIVTFLFVLFFLHLETLVFAEYGAWNIISILPHTPVVVPFIIAPCLAAYLARNGLEVISRVNQIFLPVFLIFFATVIVLSAQDMRIAHLLPVFDGGLAPIVKGAIAPMGLIGEIVALAVIIPYLNQPQQATRIAVSAVLTAGGLTVVGTILPLAVLGPALTAEMSYPTYMAIRMISIADFVERTDSLMVVAWTITGFIKIGLLRYLEALGIAHCFGLRDYRQLVLPLAVIVSSSALLMYGTSSDTGEFISKYAGFFHQTFELVIPLFLLIVAQARGLHAKNS